MSPIDGQGLSLRHLPALDGVRALSIILVVAGHWLPLGPKILQLNTVSAAMGMSLFFILSGFLITRALHADNDLLKFLIRRLARIAPLAFLYMALVSILFVPDLGSLLSQLTFTLNYHPEAITPFNAHLWSLCVEVQFYAAAGLIFALAPKPAPFLILLLCGAVTVLKIVTGDAFSMQTHLRGDELLAGALLYMSAHGRFGDHAAFWRRMEGLTPVLLVLLILTCHPGAGPLDDLRAYVGAGLVGSVLSSRRVWLSRLLGSRSMAYVAKISYGVYVIHIGAAASLAAVLGTGSKLTLYLVQRPLAAAATWGLAHLSCFFYEKWWNDLGRDLIKILARSGGKSVAESAKIVSH